MTRAWRVAAAAHRARTPSQPARHTRRRQAQLIGCLRPWDGYPAVPSPPRLPPDGASTSLPVYQSKPSLLHFCNKRAIDRACQRRSTARGCVPRHCQCHQPLAARRALSNAPSTTSRANGVGLWQPLHVQDQRTTPRRPSVEHAEDEPGRHCHAPRLLQHDHTSHGCS